MQKHRLWTKIYFQMNDLTLDDINDKIRPKVYTQSYLKKAIIDDVKIIDIPCHVGDDGDFIELMRIEQDGELEQLPGFKLAQISRTLLLPHSVKAWHLHFNQNEIWFVPPESRLLVGLWDVRKNSKTSKTVMRLAMGGGKAQLVYIPKGVAHGSANLSEKPIPVIYFVDRKFDINNPDEKRIKWDSQGADFWQPQRD